MIDVQETNPQATGIKSSEIDFKKIVTNLEAHLDSLQKTACPKHEKVKLSCVCLNPNCHISVLCSKCLIDDLEHYKTCGKKQQILQMADLRQQYGTVLRLSNEFNFKALETKLKTMRESSLQIISEKIASEITAGIDTHISRIFENIE